MSPTTPDHEPLDPLERELARVLHALPAGEPSPALDARILKAASDAVAAAPPARRFGWLAAGGPLWGIGSAAAAVLAIGIAWQVYAPVPRPLAPTSPVPVSVPIDHEAPLEVEFRDRAVPAPTAAPPAPAARDAPMPQAMPVPAAAPLSKQRAAPTRNALDEAVPHQPTPLPAAPAMSPQAEGLAAPAVAAQRSAPMAKAASAERAADVASGAATATDATTLARVRSDAHRYPESWLLKIRARRDEGDLAGARASLQLFHRTYPSHPVPDDLQPLLAP